LGVMAHKRSYTNVIVHLVWATRYRAPVLEEQYDAWLSRVLLRKAFEVGCQAFAVGMGRDHVHSALRLGSSTALSEVARHLKGASSHTWNLSHRPRLRWQDGYWAESVRPEDLRALCEYIRIQRERHCARDLQERWMNDSEIVDGRFSPPLRGGLPPTLPWA
jgi:REP element-mobilizing transposase RayT